MKLYVMRHGIAAPHADYSRDGDRPLTEEGIDKTRRIARGLASLDLGVGRILTSPLTRARQTAELVAQAFNLAGAMEEAPELASGAAPKDMMNCVRQASTDGASVLIVGHEPDLSRFIAWLICGATGAQFSMKKGGVAQLTVEPGAGPGTACLDWLMAPGQLARLR